VASDVANTELDEIQRQMARIRRELRADVRDVISSASGVFSTAQGVISGAHGVIAGAHDVISTAGRAFQLRRIVQRHPWASLGVAAAIGYLLVPRRSGPRAPNHQPAQSAASGEPYHPLGLARALVDALLPLAIRVGQGYAAHLLEQWIENMGTRSADVSRSDPERPNANGPAG
jgi:ElaB/YqjD/DUF883 family membrane-anchored ribosome-binding protein